MESKFIGGILIGAVLVAGAGFWVGMSYGSARTAGGRGAMGERQLLGGAMGGGTFRASGAGAVFGTIIAKDANSITVQLGGGPNASSTNAGASGSKIVLLNANTEVGKTVAGSSGDLVVGQTVVVNGTPNSDGSITAAMVQIRPEGTPRGR